jgi:2-dehydro-3-deoxygluconokinase
MSTLKIKEKTDKGIDFISLGALVVRLDSGIVPLDFANNVELHVSGGEFNVAANLSKAFEMKTAIASAMVDYPIGNKIKNEVNKMGVIPFYKNYDFDGVRGPNMALVYSDRGQGSRAPVVFYNRSNEAASYLNPSSFDWDSIFSNNIRWFHSGGIFSALGPDIPETIIKGMKEAHKNGAIVSFDLNYRAKLWESLKTGDKTPKELPQETLSRIVENVDVLFGNEEDLQLGLGLKGPDVAKQGKLDSKSFYSMMNEVTKRFPNIKAVATTMREVVSTNKHNWSAVLWYDGKGYQAPTMTLDVYDRVGGGDGFAAGLIYGLLDGRSPEEALRLGWAHGGLLTTFPGDTTMATLNQVEALANGANARIQR